MLHVLVGDNETPRRLREAERRSAAVRWTVPKRSSVGDDAILFVGNRLLGLGQIVTRLTPAVFKKRPAYDADVGELRLFPHEVPLDTIASAFPNWGWPRYPRSYVTVPAEIEDSLLEILERFGSEGVPTEEDISKLAMPAEAIEGALTEIRTFGRKRSQALRNAAFRRANGICAACGVDYSTVLGGLGLKVLQVHHCMQLSALEVPRVTRLEDLAVLCANCHALVHATPERAMPVEELRERLQCQGNG